MIYKDTDKAGGSCFTFSQTNLLINQVLKDIVDQGLEDCWSTDEAKWQTVFHSSLFPDVNKVVSIVDFKHGENNSPLEQFKD